MKRAITAIALTAASLAGSVAAVHAGGSHGSGVQSELAAVRAATARYHRLDVALAEGYAPFSIDPAQPEVPTCFDHPDHGGMGVHYVQGIDGHLDVTEPEALVYALTDAGPRLVGVEYIVPEGLVDPANPPSLFGHTFHPHSFLPVYILHAWVWKHNPTGMFADFNPRVGPCPSG